MLLCRDLMVGMESDVVLWLYVGMLLCCAVICDVFFMLWIGSLMLCGGFMLVCGDMVAGM